MGSAFHIGEVAALLFLAYMLGWVVGYVARRVTSGRPETMTLIEAERLAIARGESVAVVAVPEETSDVAASVAMPEVSAVPTAPVPVVASPSAATGLQPTPPAAPLQPPMAPAPVAAAQMSEPATQSVATPRVVAPVHDDADEFVVLRGAGTRRTAQEAAPATRAGMAWQGDINGHEAPVHSDLLGGRPTERVWPARPRATPRHAATGIPPAAITPEVAAPAAETAAVMIVETAPVPVETEELSQPEAAPIAWARDGAAPAIVDPRTALDGVKADDVPPVDVEPEYEVAPPLSEIIAQQAPHLAALYAIPAPDPLPELEPEPVPEPVVELELEPPTDDAGEDDAMRAIEGGWSRRRVRAMADRPELIDVSAAVAAAQSAVQQVLAQTEIGLGAQREQESGGKPQGLPRPRDGSRDNLREIMGLSPLDESTLNNLGIYHFEQISNWTGMEVLWLEDHVFARGRIAREQWQAQALELSRRRPTPSRSARS